VGGFGIRVASEYYHFLVALTTYNLEIISRGSALIYSKIMFSHFLFLTKCKKTQKLDNKNYKKNFKIFFKSFNPWKIQAKKF
jgi:hypothetical protein